MSTVALVTIGAILTYVQGNKGAATFLIMASLSMVAISAVLGFEAMNHIISQGKAGKPLRWSFRWERSIATAVFATGLGMLMSEIGRTAN